MDEAQIDKRNCLECSSKKPTVSSQNCIKAYYLKIDQEMREDQEDEDKIDQEVMLKK